MDKRMARDKHKKSKKGGKPAAGGKAQRVPTRQRIKMAQRESAAKRDSRVVVDRGSEDLIEGLISQLSSLLGPTAVRNTDREGRPPPDPSRFGLSGPKARVFLCDAPRSDATVLVPVKRRDDVKKLLKKAKKLLGLARKPQRAFLAGPGTEVLRSADLRHGDRVVFTDGEAYNGEGGAVGSADEREGFNPTARARPTPAARGSEAPPAPALPVEPRAEAPLTDAEREEGARMQARLADLAAMPRYQSLLRERQQLPVFARRAEVLAAVRAHQVVVVSGATGSGKTTQVPQFILDSEIARGAGARASIVCTQPRRISAISVAERVAAERCEEVGGSVGYHIRLERRVSPCTRLVYCTVGVLLRMMQVRRWRRAYCCRC